MVVVVKWFVMVLYCILEVVFDCVGDKCVFFGCVLSGVVEYGVDYFVGGYILL